MAGIAWLLSSVPPPQKYIYLGILDEGGGGGGVRMLVCMAWLD